MTRHSRSLAPLAVLAALALSACAGQGGNLLDLSRRAPDEFLVTRTPPLTLPPEFRLPPPEPASARRDEDELRRSLTGADAAADAAADTAPEPASPIEGALLGRLGGAPADPDIRALIDRENAVAASDDPELVDRLLFWRDKPEPGTVIDAAKEAERLETNRAEGRPANEGPTAVIERRPRSGPSIF